MLQVKAVAAEAAADVADGVMRLCGGAAFRKELGIERRYRDALAARVMAPTTEALHDFVGRATLGLPAVRGCLMTLLMGAVAYDPKVVTIWDGFRHWLRAQGLDFDYVLYSHYERQVEDLVAGHIHAAWNSPLAWVRSERLAATTGRRVESAIMRDTDQDLTSVVVVRADSPASSPRRPRGRDGGGGGGRLPAVDADPAVVPAGAGARPTCACGASTSASGCTATTSAASATPLARWWRARSTPPA